jgi:hypothetical protein
LLLGVIGMTAGTAVLFATPALAGVGTEPGNLKLNPGSGPVTQTPTWSTTDGCPAGYRGSAQVAIFGAHGKFISLISNVAYGVTSSFGGSLDGSMATILKFADIPRGASLEFAVGCDSQIGGTGNTKWQQSTFVTLSSNGQSYTTSAASNDLQGSPSYVQHGSKSNTSGVSTVTTAANTSGMGSGALAGLIAGPCLALAAIAAFIVYRRRDRSRLM